ncbi:MAG: IS1096 element passenger TnpR family protein [Pseudonocardia sp.]
MTSVTAGNTRSSSNPPGMADPDLRYPRCISGEGACPPEDCGGSGGYQHLREVLADADDAEHEAMAMWLGLEKAAEFDVAAFDLEQVNRRLTAVDRRDDNDRFGAVEVWAGGVAVGHRSRVVLLGSLVRSPVRSRPRR